MQRSTDSTVSALLRPLTVRPLLFAVIAVLGLILYGGLVTGFTFDLLGPEAFSLAYNAYFLSAIDGRLDVAEAVIGPEGVYVGDAIYMYYGFLPALFRLPAWPFVDLATTPVARLTILVPAFVSALAVQILLHALFFGERDDRSSDPLRVPLYLLTTAALWLTSAYTLLVQSGSLYHEPYAAAMLLVTLFVVPAAGSALFRGTLPRRHLWPFALLAALCVHARPPVAIALYVATAVLIVLAAWAERGGGGVGAVAARLAVAVVRRGWLSAVILGLGAGVLAAMNLARFGDPTSAGAIEQYGYFVAGEGYSPRIAAFMEHGRFNLMRLAPNLMYYVVGGWDLHQSLIERLDLGFIRIELPAGRLALLWSLPLAAAAYGAVAAAAAAWRGDRGARSVLVLAACMLPSAVLILSYGTVTYRYRVELWPVILPLAIWGCVALRRSLSGRPPRTRRRLMAGMLALLVPSVAYNAVNYLEYKDFFPPGTDNYTRYEDFRSRTPAASPDRPAARHRGPAPYPVARPNTRSNSARGRARTTAMIRRQNHGT